MRLTFCSVHKEFIKENMDVFDWELSAGDFAKLNNVSHQVFSIYICKVSIPFLSNQILGQTIFLASSFAHFSP
jgi:hypothetical protein